MSGILFAVIQKHVHMLTFCSIYYKIDGAVVVQELYGAYIHDRFVHIDIYYAQIFEHDRDVFLDAFAVLNE